MPKVQNAGKLSARPCAGFVLKRQSTKTVISTEDPLVQDLVTGFKQAASMINLDPGYLQPERFAELIQAILGVPRPVVSLQAAAEDDMEVQPSPDNAKAGAGTQLEDRGHDGVLEHPSQLTNVVTDISATFGEFLDNLANLPGLANAAPGDATGALPAPEHDVNLAVGLGDLDQLVSILMQVIRLEYPRGQPTFMFWNPKEVIINLLEKLAEHGVNGWQVTGIVVVPSAMPCYEGVDGVLTMRLPGPVAYDVGIAGAMAPLSLQTPDVTVGL
ncbi:hypothetical protein AURDEDRAFT_178011 [Auricularia subglabra TFB-10046 SS5]|uniref:Uncharacterized protein n=1 Tax=Auricularia subglabra (strain TFB-10046 / SS5) TaxID=717982 RepID=J0WKR3_AURST|nr:hypothetical protein AURDEDRAFT_178011 [Auricularia subglabra TFB-10046 SS5]